MNSRFGTLGSTATGRPRRWARYLAVASVAILCSCGLDGLVLTELTRGDNAPMPPPAPQTLQGKVAQGAKALISVRTSTGEALAGLAATVADDENFKLTLDGGSGLTNQFVQARQGRRQWLALVPELPRQPSVLAPPRSFDLADLSPGAVQMDATTTAMALLGLGKVRASNLQMASVSSAALTDTLIEVHQKLLGGDPALLAFVQVVANIDAQAALTGAENEVPYDLSASGSYLRAAFLQANPTDQDGDGQADATTAVFDAALAAALGSFQFHACYQPGRIKVVIQTRLQEGALDRNCTPIDPYLWTKKAPSKQVFVTGGIHKDTLRCEAAPAPTCLTDAQIDAGNAVLGNWSPNAMRMYDDGSHGDAKSGDGTYTIAVDMPYIEPVQGVMPVRIAYKFTYGLPAQGWTDAEEFPGNQRILELVDVDGDHIITRFDFFADETSNKDKKNGLFASAGGCGEMTWPQVSPADCVSDARERKMDLDGDCKIDGFASPGPVTPLSVPCPK